MKNPTTAKLNVKKCNQYSALNGLSFQVKDTYTCKGKMVYGLLGVNKQYPNNTTDFTQDEVVLEDGYLNLA